VGRNIITSPLTKGPSKEKGFLTEIEGPAHSLTGEEREKTNPQPSEVVSSINCCSWNVRGESAPTGKGRVTRLKQKKNEEGDTVRSQEKWRGSINRAKGLCLGEKKRGWQSKKISRRDTKIEGKKSFCHPSESRSFVGPRILMKEVRTGHSPQKGF